MLNYVTYRTIIGAFLGALFFGLWTGSALGFAGFFIGYIVFSGATKFAIEKYRARKSST